MRDSQDLRVQRVWSPLMVERQVPIEVPTGKLTRRISSPAFMSLASQGRVVRLMVRIILLQFHAPATVQPSP